MGGFCLWSHPRGRRCQTLPEFSSGEDVTRWLKVQPQDVSVAFAARAALRVIPVFKMGRPRRLRRTLRMFRCVAAAWTVAAYPDDRDKLVAAALNAFNFVGLKPQGIQRSESAAISAAAAASLEGDILSSASAAASSAIDAAASMGRESFEDALAALASDAEQLARRLPAPTLAKQPLWLNTSAGLPDRFDDEWQEQKASLLSANEHWGVWTTWYEDRLIGQVHGAALEVARVADVPAAVWKSDPIIANTFIQNMKDAYSIRHDTAGDDPPNPGNSVAFQRWLSTKPREWAAVLAVRATLRLISSLGGSPGDATLLSVFRTLSASRYALLDPAGVKLANEATGSLLERTTQITIAAFYAGLAVGAEDADSRAVSIISDFGGQFGPAWNAAILRDALQLQLGMPPRQVAQAPLWRPKGQGGIPPAVRKTWLELADVLRRNGEHWSVWVEWYDYVLEGSPPAEQQGDTWEKAFVGLLEPLPWHRGAKVVNAEIAARLKSHQLIQSEQVTAGAGVDPEPIEGVESPIHIQQRTDGRIGADPGSLATPYLPPPLTEADHARALSACRSRAQRVNTRASAVGFQGRHDYADALSAYLNWLPELPGSGNILLADGEARLLTKLFTADEGALPTGFAAQLAVLLEDHIGLRVFYPELERHYLAVKTGRLITPLERDAVESFQRAIHANTPTVFHESIGAVVDEAAKPVPELKPLSREEAPPFDPNYPRPPSDPIADIDPAKARSFILASAANRIWQVLLAGKDLPTAIEGWRRTYDQIKPYVGPLLSWLRTYLSGGDGGGPPLPPTITT
ncbi:hypothetical protein AB7M74_001792 [Bradyrhizobium japonicum]